MKEKIKIKYYEKCPICNDTMKVEVKELDTKSGLLIVEYKCQKHHKTITKSIKEFELPLKTMRP